MQTIQQARRRNESLGEPVPLPFQGFIDNEIYIRKGQLTLIAMGPGGGKTALIQAALHYGGGRNNRSSVLYLSADSGPEVMYERAAALSTGLDTSTVREMTAAGNVAHIDAEMNVKHNHIRYDFTGSPSEDHILAQLDAYVELVGEYPEVIVMDNLKDLADDEQEGEWRALEDAMMFLKDLARDARAAVVALHHVGGEYENGDMPIPLNGLRGKVGKTPAMVLTGYRPGGSDSEMRVSVVKNRNGKVNPLGTFWVPLEVNLGKMQFKG